jgi:hypothetical protein
MRRSGAGWRPSELTELACSRSHCPSPPLPAQLKRWRCPLVLLVRSDGP